MPSFIPSFMPSFMPSFIPSISTVNVHLLIKTVFSLVLSLFITAQSAAATLTVPDSFVIKTVDGKKISKSLFSRYTKIPLKQGRHTIVLMYEDLFEDLDYGYGNSATVKSEKFVIKFTLLDEQNLTLSTTEIKDQQSAKLYAKSPKVMLKDENNSVLAITYLDFPTYKAKQDLNKMMSLAANEPVKYQAIQTNKKQTILTSDNQTILPSTIENVGNNENTSQLPPSLSMLKFWWEQASTKERSSFVDYINSH